MTRKPWPKCAMRSTPKTRGDAGRGGAMPSSSPTTAPTFTVYGGEPTDAALEALARLLLDLVQREEEIQEEVTGARTVAEQDLRP